MVAASHIHHSGTPGNSYCICGLNHFQFYLYAFLAMKNSRQYYLKVLGFINGLIVLYLLNRQIWILYLAIGLASLSILFPVIARLLGTLLEKVLFVAGLCVNILLLTLIYIILVTPLALYYQVSQRKNKAIGSSTFDAINKTYTPEDLKHQW